MFYVHEDRCIRRMLSYVKLAVAVVQAEWPDYELLVAFKIFNLVAPANNRRLAWARVPEFRDSSTGER